MTNTTSNIAAAMDGSDVASHTGLIGRAESALALAGRVPDSLISTLARIAVSGVFWRSGQTKVSGWEITQITVDLFRDEYQVPLVPPEFAAYMATYSEHLFPILLVLGFASRLSAGALLGMTLVIQLFVYPDSWPEHAMWATALLFIVIKGPGVFSIDHWIRRRVLKTRSEAT